MSRSAREQRARLQIGQDLLRASARSRSLAALGMTTKFRPRRVCAVSGLVRVQQLMLVSKTELSPPDPEIPRRSQNWGLPGISDTGRQGTGAADTTDTALKPLTEKRVHPLAGGLQRERMGNSRLLSRMTRLTFGCGPTNSTRPRGSRVTFK